MRRSTVLFAALATLLIAAAPARAQQYGEAGPGFSAEMGPFQLSMHGFFRAPLRFSWRCRNKDATGSCQDPLPDANGAGSKYSVHSPWLVDDDYFRSGFAYMRTQEQDYSELYLGVGTKHVTAEVAIMGSLFSDWARPLLEKQLGISQGFVRFNWEHEGKKVKLKLQLKGGAFWDRFGWLESYDTYVFGRTHQMGAQVRGELSWDKLEAWALYGVGAHLEALDINEGLTLLNYIHMGLAWDKKYQLGFYFLDANTSDKRQLSMLTDADMQVTGFDAAIDTAYTGRLYVAASLVAATRATFLSPAIEVIHSYGGRGLTENFLGTDKSDNGTGNLWNLAFEGRYSLKRLLKKLNPEKPTFLGAGDLSLRYFGLATYTESVQRDLKDPTLNRDNRTYFKWGGELSWLALPWLMGSVRYDRVILDMNDDAGAFRVLSPKLTFLTHYFVDAQIFLQYSHYFYGDRVALRPGQVALETVPDGDVFKIQAQIVF